MRDPKPLFISVFLFGAWLVAATGWVRLFAVIGLIYPIFVVGRFRRRRRGNDDHAGGH